MTNITNEDRERYLEWSTLPPADAAAVRAGEWDCTTGMQILAAHRQSAYAKGLADGAERERAGVVAYKAAVEEVLAPLRRYFDDLASKSPDDHPHWPSGVRPFSTGDVKWMAAALAALPRHADQGRG